MNRCWTWGIGLVIGFSALVGVAAPPPEVQREANAIATIILRAEGLYGQKKYAEAGAAIKVAQERLEKLGAWNDKDSQVLLKKVWDRLERNHGSLELEGITLNPLKKPDPNAPKPAPANPANPAIPAVPATGGPASFVKHVAPMLLARCGRCHVNDMKGEFSMATFEALMKGPKGARVIVPGDDSSRIIEVIATGDMPRGGGKLQPEEMTRLKQWIKEGAKFDGPAPTAALNSFAMAVRPEANVPPPPVVKATGKETISFARDIAPLLAQSCGDCHGTERPRAMFSANTFQSLLKGGESGPNIVPGKGADSLLVKKLKGLAGDRMPLNLDPLPTDAIAKIEKWIAEGAKFDGDSPTTPIARLAAVASARNATHEELSKQRVESAMKAWRLGMGSVKSTTSDTTNFHLVGNVGENTLADIGEQAEAMGPKVAEIFKAPADQPLIKGKMTLFVFSGRYDYSEFGKMVEKRTLPPEMRGHWRYDVVTAYGAMIPPKNNEYSLPTLIGQQLAAAYVSSQGEVPNWFSEGAGRVAAARLDARDARVIAWDKQLPEAMSRMTAADDVVTGKLLGEDGNVAAYGLVKFLMADGRRFGKLIEGLQAKQTFDAAFATAYGNTPSALSMAWVKKPILGPTKPGPTKKGA